MAYSGARVNEITQLRSEDIFELEGVTVMRITPDAGPVKAKVARIVPLHTHLVDQGFLEFVAAKGAGPLFYDPAKRRSDRGGAEGEAGHAWASMSGNRREGVVDRARVIGGPKTAPRVMSPCRRHSRCVPPEAVPAPSTAQAVRAFRKRKTAPTFR